ncbi:glycosyltransferase [Rhodobacteraceae bacterium 63075]|nr:glycosyltransferase [Rhodobacteraceae bacterium 63075]
MRLLQNYSQPQVSVLTYLLNPTSIHANSPWKTRISCAISHQKLSQFRSVSMTSFSPVQQNQLDIIRESAFFDAEFYESAYPDVPLIGLDAAEHYLRIGGRLGRSPGPDFDGAAYIATYLDVAARGDNPLVHFECFGRGEGRSPMPERAEPDAGPNELAYQSRVDVVVPVFNALEDVQACLASLERHPSDFKLRVLVINDGSDSETSQWLRAACADMGSETVTFELIEHDGNLGYTRAVNTGLKASDAPYVVTLNSDTIVTPGWIDGLVRCMRSSPEIGITGPLSNAASWQNVPVLMAEEGGFAVNSLPQGMSPDDMAGAVQHASRHIYPRSPFVNGFCFMIRREVLDAIGYMDEGTFPTGYGEENDFCIRAQDAGFALAFADDTYVLHAKSKSFGKERRDALSKAGSAAIREKHGAGRFEALAQKVANLRAMDLVRRGVVQTLGNSTEALPAETTNWVLRQKVLFLLPVGGGGGGAHSVVQEAAAMRKLGVDAKVAVRDQHYFKYVTDYRDIPDVDTLFIGFQEENIVATAQAFDVVIATIYSSVALLEHVVKHCPWILPVYYTQDYEPMFFEKGSENWNEANASYALIPHALLMAKTDWIRQQIESRHGVEVHKVEPSLDHDVYHPEICAGKDQSRICISAMVRPGTPRRGAGRTMELLARLKASHGDHVDIRIFGCDSEAEDFKALEQDFDFTNHGVLTRPQVADVLRRSDIFIDLSDYQAFGRTSLEAMACATVPLVPQEGGGDEYALHKVNALVADTHDVEACHALLTDLLQDRPRLGRMQLHAMRTASRYSPRRAAMSELLTFAPALAARRSKHPDPVRPKVVLVPGLRGTDHLQITGSGYVRLLCPYRQDALARRWETSILHDGTLPEPGSADVAILQRDLLPGFRDSFGPWAEAWRARGGRLIYELDDDLLDGQSLKDRGYGEDTDALRARVHAYAEEADLITVSTEHLASVMSTYASKINVVPNYIDEKLWLPEGGVMPAPRDEGPIRLGYVGKPEHAEDMLIVRDAITSLESTHDIEVQIIGAFQDAPTLFGKRKGLPRDRSYLNFVDWIQKVAFWDIAIIPLADTSFNRSKSNLKFKEYAALNTAIVCSDNPEYRRVARHEENCLLTDNTTEGWKRALTRVIEDAALRRKLAKNALKDLANGWTVQKNAALYEDTLERALKVE